ncbi:EI24 domain-containing protein [Myxococcota bacterium]|nr:EI24 domain-containing protein [Myxococcota bacterium]
MAGFLAGAATPLRGLRLVASDRALRLLALAPLGIAAVVGAAVLVGGVLSWDDLYALVRPEGTGAGATARRWAVAAAVTVAVIALGIASWIALSSALAAPFLEELSARAEAKARGVPADSPFRLADLAVGAGRAVLHAALRGGLWLSIVLPALVLNLLPVVGPVLYGAVAVAWSGFWLVFGAADPALDRRGLGFRDRLAACRSRPAATAGMAATLLLFSLVPGLNLLLLPGTVAGGALWVLALEADAALPRPPGRGGGGRAGKP